MLFYFPVSVDPRLIYHPVTVTIMMYVYIQYSFFAFVTLQKVIVLHVVDFLLYFAIHSLDKKPKQCTKPEYKEQTIIMPGWFFSPFWSHYNIIHIHIKVWKVIVSKLPGSVTTWSKLCYLHSGEAKLALLAPKYCA